jgi:hypothetical protein
MQGCSGSPEVSSPEMSPSETANGGAASGGAGGAGGASRVFVQVGSVEMHLYLPSGQSLQVFSWSVTDPNGANTLVKNGTIMSPGLQTSFLVGGIPAGNGYSIALSGTTPDGSLTCGGSAQFEITPSTTTQVTVQMLCSEARPLGSGGSGGSGPPPPSTPAVPPLGVAGFGAALCAVGSMLAGKRRKRERA